MRFFPLLLVGMLLSPCVLQAANSPSKPAVDTAKNQPSAAKLDQILLNQKEILKQLAEIKEELLIVKARATR